MAKHIGFDLIQLHHSTHRELISFSQLTHSFVFCRCLIQFQLDIKIKLNSGLKFNFGDILFYDTWVYLSQLPSYGQFVDFINFICFENFNLIFVFDFLLIKKLFLSFLIVLTSTLLTFLANSLVLALGSGPGFSSGLP